MKQDLIVAFLHILLIAGIAGTTSANPDMIDEPWRQGNQKEVTEAKKAEVTAKMMRMQIPFIANQGQMDEQVAFYAKTFGGTVFVTKEGNIVYALPKVEDEQTTTGVVLREELVGGTVQHVTGEKEAVTRVSYFKGNEPSQWQSNIPTYQYINLGEVYEDIEVKLKVYGNNVEKLFMLQPGASPETIRLQLNGAQGITVNENGELEVETEPGIVTFTKPVAYQEKAGKKNYIKVAYTIKEDVYGFTVEEYDPTKELIIDPLLASTFLGGRWTEEHLSIALDSNGNVYVSGHTSSTDFPTSVGVYNTNINDDCDDIFVSKFDGDLTTLLLSTFLGGSTCDSGGFVTLDSSGNVYVAGYTFSSDFPTTLDAYDRSHNGNTDVFVSKLDSNLTMLLASTFLGGLSQEFFTSLSLDDSEHVYVVGRTPSSDFPTTPGAYDTSLDGYNDGFVSKFDSDLTTLLASTFFGGSGNEYILTINLATNGNVYVVGDTRSSNFPTTPSAYDTSLNAYNDGFVSKFNNDLTTLLASTFLGGSENDGVYAIAVNINGNVYVAGRTYSSDFPTTLDAYDRSHNGNTDVFVSKLDSNLTMLLASTFLGGSSGSGDEGVSSITLDDSGNLYVAGYTYSPDFPTILGAYDITHNGDYDVFISKLDPDLIMLLVSTFIGEDQRDFPGSIALGESGNVLYVAGHTDSSDFPTTASAYNTSFSGYSDGFVSMLDRDLSADPPAPTVSYFEFSSINEQIVNQPFNITIVAKDIDGNIVTNINGTVSTGATIGQINPIWTILTNGSTTLNVTLDSPGSGVKLWASGQGSYGESNAFNLTGGISDQACVSGVVRTASGNLITWATVTLSREGEIVDQEFTGFGDYQFLNLAPGEYTIQAETPDGRTSREYPVSLSNYQHVTVDLILGSSLCNPEGHIPILLVPGIMGSSTGWGGPYPNLPKHPPEWNDSDWETSSWGLHDPLRLVGWRDLMGIFTTMEDGYEIGCTVFPVPYDWRMNIDKAATTYLKPWINEAKQRANMGEVNIIAHSMGGLVTRAYIQSDDYEDDIEKFAMVGTPNHGSGMAYYLWQGGNPIMADTVSGGFAGHILNFYEEVVSRQYLKFYHTRPFWCSDILNFVWEHARSIQQLLPDYTFLIHNNLFGPLYCEPNLWLMGLNNSGRKEERMGKADNTEDKVKTKIFRGKEQDTLMAISVGPSDCKKLIYRDGKPLSGYHWEKTTNGDGTVMEISAYLGDFVDYADEESSSHSGLIKTYKDDLVEFMTGSLGAGLTIQDIQKQGGIDDYELNISVLGRTQLYMVDPLGRTTGIDPNTSLRINDIPETTLFADGNSMSLTIRNATEGGYTLSLKNGYLEDYQVLFSYMDAEETFEVNYMSFSHTNTISFTIDFDPSNTEKIMVNRTPAPPSALQADTIENGSLLTRLSWEPNSDPEVTGYNIYAKNDNAPYLTQIGTTTETFYDTGDLWAENASIPTRIYAISALKWDDTESFLSEMVQNNDRDHDRLIDEQEALYCTDINKPDTDEDGLNDGEECFLYGTDPLLIDTDGDTYSDYDEVQVGTDPTDPNSIPIYEINVKQAETGIPVGGVYDFGDVNMGSSSTVAFTIENLGTALLNLTGSPAVDITGDHAAAFIVTQQPTIPISPIEPATFNITFTPEATGERTATVSIANNDADENPYTFTVTGTGQASNSYILWTK